MRAAAAATARKPKTAWQHLYGHKRPASRWKRQREKWAHRREYEHECRLGCRQHFTRDAARVAHEYLHHRGAWMRRELLQIERDAKWQKFTTDDCRSWAGHPLARRYRRLMRRYWALDREEYTQSLAWHAGNGSYAQPLPLTRLGWPSAGAPLDAYIRRARKRLRGRGEGTVQ